LKIKSLKAFGIALRVCFVALILLVAVAVWNLYQGGISLGFIAPIAERALASENPNLKVKFEKAEITFVKKPFPLGIRVKGFRLLDGEKPMAIISEMKMSFSLKGLLQGEFVPNSVFLYRPFISVYIEQNGNIGVGFDASDAVDDDKKDSSEVFAIDAHTMLNVYKNISSLTILDGQVMIRDRKHATNWLFPDVDLYVVKLKDAIKAKGNATLLQHNKNISPISIAASFDISEHILDLDVDAENFHMPKGVRKVLLADTQVSMPLQGKIKAKVDLSHKSDFDTFRKRVKSLEFVFNGGEGNLVFQEPVAASYDVENVTIEGFSNGGFSDTKLTKLEAKTVTGAYVVGNANIYGIDSLIDTGSFGALRIDFNVMGENISMDKLKQYWPPVLGPMTHEWVMDNLTDGKVDKAEFDLLFTGSANGDIDLEKVSGEVDISGATVRYLEGMPLVYDTTGRLFLTKDDVTIKIDKGRSLDLTLYDSELYFYDIWEPQEQAKMDIKVKGSLADAMVLLDTEPLAFLKDLGLSREGIEGKVETVLHLQFPLRKDLTANKVKVDATAKIAKATLPWYKDFPLLNAELDLAVNNKQMKIWGSAEVKKIPVKVSWIEIFQGKKAGSEYEIAATLTDEERTRLGLDFYPVSPKEISGEMPCLIKANEDLKGNVTARASCDLSKVKIDDGKFGIKKEHGVKADTSVTVKAKNNGSISVSDFRLVADNGISLSGSAAIDEKGTVRKLSVDRFMTAKNNFTADAIMHKDGIFEIDAKGKSFDATELFALGDGETSDSAGDDMQFSLRLKGAFDKVWLSEGGYIDSVLLSMFMNEGSLEDFTFTAKTENDIDINAYFKPYKNVHNLSIYTKDGGALIKALGYTSNVKGGDLKVLASSAEKGYLKGKLVMSDYKLIKAPVLAKILSVASLTGILDVLQGEGLTFDIAEVPFEFKPSGIYIKDAHTSGLSIGLTAEGSIKNGVWNMEGSIVPAYVVNSLLGKIPLIGALFSGGETGGGLIAFKYYIDGPAQDPIVRVNPLSALAPGVTRKIFSDDDNDDGEE